MNPHKIEGESPPIASVEAQVLAWLNDPSRHDLPEELSEELLDHFTGLPQFAECLKRLDSLAVPALESDSEATVLSAPASATSSSIGQLPRDFGPYLLEEEIGRGGMGVVYLARHRTLNTHFALKVIRTSELASDEEIRRFFQEAQAASRLHHPHIVNVHDAGEIDGLPYLVMQLVRGESLAQRLASQSLSLEQGLKLLAAVARAVNYLHQQGIVHRDLKPGNILLDEHDSPSVTDFGLAKVFDADSARTSTGLVMGTPAYMAPEQAWGKPEAISPQTDIYCLGAILFELLTGRAPFIEKNPLDVILRLRDAEPRRPRSLNPNIPLELEQICLRCLEKQPRDRYPDAAELANDLDRHLHHEPIALQPIGIWNGLRRWIRREPALVGHLSGFATVALVLQIADWVALGHRAAYVPVMTVLAIWTGLSVIFQQLLSREMHRIKLAWVTVDAILFTAAVSFAEGPVESLVVGYALLIVASGLWYQESLVLLMTFCSVLSYASLIGFRGMDVPDHYPFLTAGILVIVGGIVAALVRRIRLLLSIQTPVS